MGLLKVQFSLRNGYKAKKGYSLWKTCSNLTNYTTDYYISFTTYHFSTYE
jgi:hypothetical protein